MRWADLDQLGHVNNVVYVDYLQEARVDMLRAHGRGTGAMAEGLVVVRHEVTYLKPLLFDGTSVSIECWVTDIRAASFTMAYEIFREVAPDQREVYLRASTVLTPFLFADERPRRITGDERAALEQHLEHDPRPRPRATPLPVDGLHHYAVQVRFSDVDVYRHVNNVKYFEYLQEARIQLFTALAPHEDRGAAIVVAQTDVDYVQPLLFRTEPYDVASAITRVGSRSLTIESELRDGDLVCARARVVVVFFDLAEGRSTEPPAEVRERLLAEVVTG
jgi:acyl-CoA thioester hydrolase